MGVLELVGTGRPGPRGFEGESDGGVVWRGSTMRGGGGSGRDAGPVQRVGRTKVAT